MSGSERCLKGAERSTWVKLLKTIRTLVVGMLLQVSCSLWISGLSCFGHIFMCSVSLSFPLPTSCFSLRKQTLLFFMLAILKDAIVLYL